MYNYELSRYLFAFSDNALSCNEIDDNSKEQLTELKVLTDEFEPLNDNELRVFWFKEECSDFETFKQYYHNDLHYDDDDDSKEEIAYEYERYSSDINKWFKLSTVGHIDRNGEIFYGVFINNKYAIALNDSNSKGFPMDCTELIKHLKSVVINIKNMIIKGTYDEYLNDLPYEYRDGTIKRETLLEIDSEYRKNFEIMFPKETVEEFLSLDNVVTEYYTNFTARTYFEACACVYDALDIPNKSKRIPFRFEDSEEEKLKYNGMTPKEKYYTYADCRDDGLINVPLDDAEAYIEWVNKDEKYYKFNGGHPWEIIPSMMISNSIHLSPYSKEKDCTKTYLILSGSSNIRCDDTIIAYIALKKAGFNVELNDFDIIKNRITCADYIGVSDVPFYYNYASDINGIRVYDYINLKNIESRELVNRIVDNTTWEDVEVSHLLKK